jgi:hypothetical protein
MQIGNIAIIPFTLAVTQALKNLFNIDGKANQLVAIGVATILTSISLLIKNEIIVGQTALIVEIVMHSLVGGLSAIGLFDYAREEWVDRLHTTQ